VPGWSTEIANRFIQLAAAEGRRFDQMQLQELVYIAHGWCLALTGQPLTGDRPEATQYGPEYRRLADALARYGVDPVSNEITVSESGLSPAASPNADVPAHAELDSFERKVIARVHRSYGSFPASRLAAVTRVRGAPWEQVFGKNVGRNSDIPHHLIKAQFLELARDVGNEDQSPSS
jgi:uncharacterized phage-associated protein